MTRVLIVDDEPQLVRALRINLAARGYEVTAAADAAAALASAARHQPDLVILDLGLPDLDGTEVIRGLRGWSHAPIIVLSGRTDATDKVEALDVGADDYVTKPFSVEELLARMRAALRAHEWSRDPEQSDPVARVGDYVVDLAARTITRAQDAQACGGGTATETETVHLTPTEWGMLGLLLRHPGKLVSGKQLLAEVWGPGYQKETHYLRFYMARLRRKLEPDPTRPRYLLTEPGMGYRFEP